MAAVQTVLPFDLRGLRFALPAKQVMRVLPALSPLPLPQAPASVAGICQLHGKVVPVIDLSARLGWTPQPFGIWSHWIWLRSSRRELLLPVDRTEPVCHLDSELHAVSTLQDCQSGVSGVLQTAQGLYLLHDIESFLSPADEQALNHALAQHADH
ncbi:chemotaxis protein CheW [Chitinimonas sp. BJB300]|uniref:chemotaxis protein CheW n=1 Tax=Chitinimonas sp. BJB300 TaxID=1559339 RepID=UPI000C119C35|nr:chemotaxis protein CheW [Chitinimonas sp. BJB300]PHV12855.1 chemotaxis protein CheW [Chitinimonas sp. BJB300]TSJ86113.1 chemotaxis protein CheW [Chitinimonas sp. BJB300]